ncbi:MAG: YggS family pyridoxal phosphate-dependent enzyme [Holophaga sp.]
MIDLARRIHEVEARISSACAACGRSPESVELLPVSKRQPSALIREAASLGYRCFGENYVQEGSAKAQELPQLEFVLIGPLQRNKAKPALQHFHEILSLDRPELATRLRQMAEELEVTRKVWIQVDLWDEATKMGGCTQNDLPALMEALGEDPRLPLQGFMAIPPPERRKAFQEVAQLRALWQDTLGRPLRLSLGMSDDLEAAIAVGSDQVRIGTAFFGSRRGQI